MPKSSSLPVIARRPQVDAAIRGGSARPSDDIPSARPAIHAGTGTCPPTFLLLPFGYSGLSLHLRRGLSVMEDNLVPVRIAHSDHPAAGILHRRDIELHLLFLQVSDGGGEISHLEGGRRAFAGGWPLLRRAADRQRGHEQRRRGAEPHGDSLRQLQARGRVFCLPWQDLQSPYSSSL